MPDAVDKPALSANPWNLPNLITLVRLGMSLVLFGLMDFNTAWAICATVFAVAAGTDFLDGYIARKYKLVTVLGRILDPFVDKVIVCGAFLFLLPHVNSGVTAWMALVVIGREMLVTQLRSWLEQQGRDFSAAWIGKLKMLLQCVALVVAMLLLDPAITAWLKDQQMATAATISRDLLLWTATGITVYSGAIYVLRGISIYREIQRGA